MDWGSTLRLKLLLTVFLLTSANVVCLHGNPTTGGNRKLHCVNDYLFTINCSVSITPSENTLDKSSYWLTLTETHELNPLECVLENTNGNYSCSVKTLDPDNDETYYFKTFMDMDNYEISLCHNQNNGSETCELLEEYYMPVSNIKPNPPCCLTVSHNSSQHHFTWKSTYEEYRPYIGLPEDLKYQLHYYKRGDNHDKKSREINTDSMEFFVDDQHFVPHTEYAARVRTSPSQAFYKGQWSDWSSEVHWKMESAGDVYADLPSNTFVFGRGRVFIPLCVMVPLILILLCYAPVKKWRQGAFIPTPAPYFHTLYTDCQGDFKSWVVTQENTSDMLKAEETLQIDTLTKCMTVQEEECQPQFHHHVTEGGTYSNITDPGCDTSFLGIPYAVGTMAPSPALESSFECETLSSEPGSPAEGDSGCWLFSNSTRESDVPFYCNEYCTLSAFQQICPVTADQHTSLLTKTCPTMMIRGDAVIEA